MLRCNGTVAMDAYMNQMLRCNSLYYDLYYNQSFRSLVEDDPIFVNSSCEYPFFTHLWHQNTLRLSNTTRRVASCHKKNHPLYLYHACCKQSTNTTQVTALAQHAILNPVDTGGYGVLAKEPHSKSTETTKACCF
jgi:hypothetical protein